MLHRLLDYRFRRPLTSICLSNTTNEFRKPPLTFLLLFQVSRRFLVTQLAVPVSTRIPDEPPLPPAPQQVGASFAGISAKTPRLRINKPICEIDISGAGFAPKWIYHRNGEIVWVFGNWRCGKRAGINLLRRGRLRSRQSFYLVWRWWNGDVTSRRPGMPPPPVKLCLRKSGPSVPPFVKLISTWHSSDV